VDGNGDHMVFGAGRPQGDAGPFIDAFSRDYGGDRYPGVDVADAGSALRLSNGSSPDDEAYYGNNDKRLVRTTVRARRRLHQTFTPMARVMCAKRHLWPVAETAGTRTTAGAPSLVGA
jgi:hypothetical protein